MNKIKGLFKALLETANSPELKPLEVKIARALLAAAVAYISVHYGEKA